MTRRASPLVALACLLAGPGQAPAQETPRATTEERPARTPAPRVLDDVSLRLPTLRRVARRPGDFLEQVTLRRAPVGSLVIRYAGIESYVVRRVQGRLRALWHDTLEDAWDAGILDDEEYAAQLGRMYDALADHRAGGRWWERAWSDSLLEARGGAPALPLEHTIGQRIAFRLGPLTVTNELRAYLERVAVLSVDADSARLLRDLEPARLAREHAWLVRDARDPDELPLVEDGPEDPDDVRGDDPPVVRASIALPDPALLRMRWRLTLRPSVSVRTSSGKQLVRDVRLRTSLELYHSLLQVRLVEVEVVLRYRPDDDEVTVGLQVVLFAW